MDILFRELQQEYKNFAEHQYTDEEFVDRKSEEFNLLTERVYRSCLIYFELKGIPRYIEEFKRTYSEQIKNDLISSSLIDLSYTDVFYEEQSLVTTLFREALYPFKAFGTGDYEHLTGLDYLESILMNTSRIVKESNIIPSKESEVYNAVKLVIESTFPKKGAQFPKGDYPFYKEAKCYKPDILIPSLNCAIEYKFAESLRELNDTIDQILIDVPGYSGHDIYTLFYAVFYVKVGTASQETYLNYWKSKNIPDTWTPIFVEGETKSK